MVTTSTRWSRARHGLLLAPIVPLALGVGLAVLGSSGWSRVAGGLLAWVVVGVVLTLLVGGAARERDRHAPRRPAPLPDARPLTAS